LGLAIAKQITERLHIGISLLEPPEGHGLRVHLSFPVSVTA
jgi:signal transduction histidine kinase